MKTYNTSKLITIIAAAFLLLGVASCKKSNVSGTAGTSAVHVYLTDDPSPVFDNLFLDIQKVEVKAEDDSEAQHESEREAGHEDHDRHGSTDGGWISLDINPGIYDLLKFRNGIDTILGSGVFPVNKNLKKIRITLGQNNHAVLNGVSVPLVIKDNNNIIVINLEGSILSAATGGFHISIDIDASRSVQQHGHEFELKPEAHCFNRVRSGSIEGRVLPADAHAIVYAISGSDTTSAIPEREGEFKIAGLKDGTYTLLAHATANNYIDSSFPITVSGSEDARVETIILHK